MEQERYSIAWQKKAITISDLIRAASDLEKDKKYREASAVHEVAAKLAENLRIGDSIVRRERRMAARDLRRAEKEDKSDTEQ